ncbi:hypothetical protein [Pseudomonas chlororaphis]
MNNLLRFPALAFTAALLAACAAPTLPPAVEAPAGRFVNAPQIPAAGIAEQWWTLYHDPLLDRLVARALEENLDLQIALARIDASLPCAASRPPARAPS